MPSGPQETVGWLGTGALGMAICRRLLDSGTSLRVYNRSAERAAPLKPLGAILAASPAELYQHCSLVFLCVSDAPAIESVLFDEHQSMPFRPGLGIVNTSTIGHDASLEIQRRLHSHGVDYVECPVSGGVERARAGSLVAIVSGEAGVVARAVPTIRSFSDKIVLTPGAHAQNLKVLNNLAEALNLWVAAEVLVLASRLSLPASQVAQVLRSARGRSEYLDVMLRFVEADRTTSGVSNAIRLKDLGLALKLAERGGATLPITNQVSAYFGEAANVYGEDADQCDCLALLESMQSEHQPTGKVE